MQVGEVAGRQLPVACDPLTAHFNGALQSLLGLTPFINPLAIALSGGADSMALTLLAHAYAAQHGGTIIALTVDHGLRPESHDEAQRVAGWMRARGIPHHILTPAHRTVSRNLQEAARIWRYDALAEFCRARGILHCLLAHHAGDNRETLLHHQSRGSTPDGLAGIARVRHHHGVRFVRPLLQVERATLEDFLRSKITEWIEDPSNQNPRYARVRNRAWLHTHAAQHATLNETLATHAAARHARDHALAEAALACVALHPLGYADVALAPLMQQAPALASQLLADCARTISGLPHRPRQGDTARLMEALQRQPFTKRTLHGCELSVHNGTLRIAREAARVAAPLALSGKGNACWDGRFRLHYRITDDQTYQLRALGAEGQRLLGSRALPRATPSLWHLDTLAYVPYIMKPLSGVELTLGFAPVKPLAPPPFW